MGVWDMADAQKTAASGPGAAQARSKERGSGLVSWTFFTIVLPVVVCAVLLGAALQIVGINVLKPVGEFARSLPVVHGLFPTAAHPIKPTVASNPLKRDVAVERARIAVLVSELQQERRLAAAQTVVAAHLRAQVAAQKAQLAHMVQLRAAAAKQAAVFVDMSPTTAASVMLAQPFATQVLILKAMSPGDQAAILSGMPAKRAAALLAAAG